MAVTNPDKMSGVYPGLIQKIEQMANVFTDDDLEVIRGLASWEDQEKLYAQGRTAPGDIVTHAPPGHSWHEFGLAIDVCPVSLKSTHNWSPESPLWQKLAIIGAALGLFPGARFVHVQPDKPHFQMTGRFKASPDNEVRAIFTLGGLEAVWREAFKEES